MNRQDESSRYIVKTGVKIINDLSHLNQFVSGAITMGYVVAGLFFLKFWKKSSDRLFAFFALAFFILAAQRFALALTTQNSENTLLLYVVRLLAFLLILGAIVDKNRSAQRQNHVDNISKHKDTSLS